MVARNKAAAAATTNTVIYAFNQQRGDFDAVIAVRREADLYELLETPAIDGFTTGDLVRCELSDGELIVQGHVYSPRLI